MMEFIIILLLICLFIFLIFESIFVRKTIKLYQSSLEEYSKKMNESLTEYSVKMNEYGIKLNQKNVDLIQENIKLKVKQKDYEQFLAITLNSLEEDTGFIKSSFFQRFGALPDYQEINSQLQAFSIRIQAILEAIREYEEETKKEKQ